MNQVQRLDLTRFKKGSFFANLDLIWLEPRIGLVQLDVLSNHPGLARCAANGSLARCFLSSGRATDPSRNDANCTFTVIPYISQSSVFKEMGCRVHDSSELDIGQNLHLPKGQWCYVHFCSFWFY